MFKRLFFLSMVVLAVYIVFVVSKIQVGLGDFASKKNGNVQKQTASPDQNEEDNKLYKIYNFAFTKYDTSGERELEIQGESADMLADIVQLENVIAKAYADDIPVTITADLGNFNREDAKVFLEKNVVATTDDGARLLSNSLEILTGENIVKTQDFAEVIKDEMYLQGVGAICQQELKRVKFQKNVKVTFHQEAQGDQPASTIVITSDGPLVVNYEKDTARFQGNVVSLDAQGIMKSDQMDVFYNQESKEVERIYATGNVTLEQDGNKTYSDSVVYLAKEGRVILEGDPEAFGLPSHDEIIRSQLF